MVTLRVGQQVEYWPRGAKAKRLAVIERLDVKGGPRWSQNRPWIRAVLIRFVELRDSDRGNGGLVVVASDSLRDVPND